MTIEELVGRNVRAARFERGLSGRTLGEQIEEWLGHTWPRQTVSAIESGKRAFTAEELLALALTLEKPVSYFYRAGQGEIVTMPSGATVQREQLTRLFKEDLGAAVEEIHEVVKATRAIHETLGYHLSLVDTVLVATITKKGP